VPAREGDKVSVRFSTTQQDGTACETNREGDPLIITLGETSKMPVFEAAVIGLEPGQSATIVLPPEEAYGARHEEAIEDVPASLFGEHAKVGTEGTLTDAAGDKFPCRIIAIRDDLETATVDFNHPLAGESLNCEIELIEIISEA
jgi:peptidylprolyl isomerase